MVHGPDLHVHASHNEGMRTTIEMKPEHRTPILELAASRGEKGFSGVIAEALDFYLSAQNAKKSAIRKALALKGSLSDEEADELRARTKQLREHWR